MDKKNAPDATPRAGEAQNRLTMGNAGLDYILCGGLPANRLYLVEGDPGTGKTTLALQFLLEGVRRGEPVLYVTLSETREELTGVAESHGWTLDGLNIYELVPPEESLKVESQYTIFHPSEVELGDTTNAVIDEVERIQPRRVVFDSLSEMRLLARDPLRYRRQILALKQFFAGRQCAVLLLDDRTATDGDLQVQSIAHGVLMLEQVASDYGAERRRLRVVKLRGSRFRGGFHDFNILTGGIEVYPRLVAADHRREFARESISSSLPELDALLGGVHLARSAGLGNDFRGDVESGLVHIQQIDPAELSPGEFAAGVRRSVEHDEARVVVIDSLNGYLHAMPDERFLTVQMHELLTYLNQQGVVTMLVMAQHGFMGANMGTPVDVSYLADTVILLRYFEAMGAVRRAISVVKKRTGFHEDTIRELRLSSKGIEVGEPLTKFHGVLTGVPTYLGGRAALSGEGDDDKG